MSERSSTNAGRVDAWEERKLAHERNQWESSLYAEAGESDFSDEAKVRAQEAQDYENYMAEFANRSDDHDTIDEDRLDAIDRAIQGDAQLRRMALLANEIRAIADQRLDGTEDADRLLTRLSDKETRLQELLEEYNENGQASEHEKYEIYSRIIDMTRSLEDDGESQEDSQDQADEDHTPEEKRDDSDEEHDSKDTDVERDDSGDEPEAELTEKEIRAKRAKMVKSGIKALHVGNMSDAEIAAYNLVETEEAAAMPDGAEGEPAKTEADDESGHDSDTKGFADIDSDWANEDSDTQPEADDATRQEFEDIDSSWANEDIDEVEVDTRGWARRHWDDYRANGLGAYMGGQYVRSRSWLDARRGPESENARRNRILGAVAIGAGLLAAAWAVKNGFGVSGNTAAAPLQPGSGSGLNPNIVTAPNDALDPLAQTGGGAEVITPDVAADWINTLSNEALTIRQGEGGFQTLKEMGVPESQWESTWQQVGEALQSRGQGNLVYPMDDGRWGWSKSGALNGDALQIIESVVNR